MTADMDDSSKQALVEKEPAGERQLRRAERRRRAREGRFDSSVPSPCVAICQMDAANRSCIGCGRTIDEIRDWMIMSAGEKRAVLARLGKDADLDP